MRWHKEDVNYCEKYVYLTKYLRLSYYKSHIAQFQGWAPDDLTLANFAVKNIVLLLEPNRRSGTNWPTAYRRVA
jgi:hypothetical protein